MRTENIYAQKICEGGGQLKIAKWHKRKGSFVKKGEIIFTLENFFATCDFEAYDTGTLHYGNDEGAIVLPGQKIGSVTCIYQDPTLDPSISHSTLDLSASHSTWIQKNEAKITAIILTVAKVALAIYSIYYINKSIEIF